MIKKILKKLLLGHKSSSKDYIDYLKKKGVSIGKDVYIFCPKETSIDSNNPFLLSIGNNVKITGPTTILTHDYSTCVLNKLDNKIYGKSKKVTIGNNVFLGWGCTVLAGTNIGDNCIIGAGSVVSGKIEGNSVYAGNPAKKIMTIDEYREKIKNSQINDACIMYNEYKARNKISPSEEIFHEYFYLFSNDYDSLNEKFKNKILEEKIEFIADSKFKNYEDFKEYIERNNKNEKN